MRHLICCFLIRTSHHAEIEYFLRPYCVVNQESQISQMPLSSSGMSVSTIEGGGDRGRKIPSLCVAVQGDG